MSFAEKCLQATKQADPTINDKVATRALLQGWGYQTAELIAYVPDPMLLEPYLTGLVVVKPRNGSTSHGVHALEETEDGWYDHITDRTFTLAGLAKDLNGWNHKFGWRRGAIVETAHLFEGRLAYEYKVYSFQGPKLIQGKTIHHRFAWWHDGHRVNTGKLARKQLTDFPPPPDGLDELADSIHARFPWLGFMRIDCFFTDQGWKVGEIADHVGDRWFNDEWDRRLGEWWS